MRQVCNDGVRARGDTIRGTFNAEILGRDRTFTFTSTVVVGEATKPGKPPG